MKKIFIISKSVLTTILCLIAISAQAREVTVTGTGTCSGTSALGFSSSVSECAENKAIAIAEEKCEGRNGLVVRIISNNSSCASSWQSEGKRSNCQGQASVVCDLP